MRSAFWFTFLIFIACYITGPLVDPDLWWHVTIGRWIIANGAIPDVDYWSMFGQGSPWRAYSWSNEIVVALVDRFWGAKGLVILKLLLSCSIIFSLSYCFAKMSRDYFLGAFLGILATLSCYNHFTLRPQSFVWVLLIWAIYFAELTIRNGVTKKNALALVLIFTLWANSHITTIIGIFAVGTWLVKDFKFNRANLSLPLAAVALCILGTLLTPYFGAEWLTFFSKSGHPAEFNSIAEFQPATILQYPTGFFLITLGLVVLLAVQGKEVPRVGQIIGCASLGIAGLAVVKFLPFASIYLCAVCAYQFGRIRAESREIRFLVGLDKLRDAVLWLPAEGASFICLVLAIIYFQSPFYVPVSQKVIPQKAVDFMQKNNLGHPILNDFGRGGYIMYRYSDKNGYLEHKVPIDGRTNVFPIEVWKKHRAAEWGSMNWREYIDLVKPQTILWRTASPFVPLLVTSGEWCRVFSSGSDDDGYSVLIKREDWQIRKISSDTCKE